MDRGRMVDSPKLLGQLSKCPPAGGLLELSNPCSGKLLLSQVPVCNAEIQKPRVGQSASERKRLVRSHRGDKSGRKRIGGAEGIRTLDPHVANVVLSQLSYCPTRGAYCTCGDVARQTRGSRSSIPSSESPRHGRGPHAASPLLGGAGESG